MCAQNHIIREVPPLLYPPHWATGPLPASQELQRLERSVAVLQEQIVALQVTLDVRPHPSWARVFRIDFNSAPLYILQKTLQRLRYPPTLTRWIDIARGLVQFLTNELDFCVYSIDQMRGVSPHTLSYRSSLETARNTCQRAYDRSRELRDHILTLHQQILRKEISSRDQASDVTEQPRSDGHTLIVVDFVAERQRRLSADKLEMRLPMKLSGAQIKKLQQALISAFSEETLREMVRMELEQDLANIAAGKTHKAMIFELILWSEREERTAELIEKAQLRVPGNSVLRACAEELLPQFKTSTSKSPPEPINTSPSTVSRSKPISTRLGARMTTSEKTPSESRHNVTATSQDTTSLDTMYETLLTELDEVANVQAILSLPTPTWRRMQRIQWTPVRCQNVGTQLQALSNYHPNHTRAVDRVRGLATQMLAELEQCYAAILKLQVMLPDEEYQTQLKLARDTCNLGITYGNRLAEDLQKIESSIVRSPNL